MMSRFVAASFALSVAADNCFVPIAKPLQDLPFDGSAIVAMRGFFKANLNIDGTGAIVASPGACPALMACCNTCHGGYGYDWTRDGAISIAALQKLGGSPLATTGDEHHVTPGYVDDTMEAYLEWVGRRKNSQHEAAVYLEPKWNITTGQPYSGGWCRPQTDGPGLRAMALMQFARQHWSMRLEVALWNLIQADLDWIADHGLTRPTCDLWEETRDSSFLWNRMTMHAALLHGQQFAELLSDVERIERYKIAAQKQLGDPLVHHTRGDAVLTECSIDNPGIGCRIKRKQIDGSVILSLIHDGWPRTQLHKDRINLTTVMVARTVKAYNEAFCEAYPVNRRDSSDGVPGVLYGRYAKDVYGRGNPWVLITASLATLMYRAALVVAEGGALTDAEVDEWRAALNWSGFGGSVDDFVAAGDAVLLRIAHHVRPDGWHLFEQIDKATGHQYNAKDLTWSYAEVFIALVERIEVLEVDAKRKEEGKQEQEDGPPVPEGDVVQAQRLLQAQETFV